MRLDTSEPKSKNGSGLENEFVFVRQVDANGCKMSLHPFFRAKSMDSVFRTTVRQAVMAIYTTPSLLEQNPVEMMRKLKDHCDTQGQGSANPVTKHEGCIAAVLEANGIRLATERNKVPVEHGIYFWYQAGGTQQKGDFTLFAAKAGVSVDSITLDAKHSNGTSIYLNDGTFETNVLYVISITLILPRVKGQRKGERKNVCIVSLGQDIMTPEDTATMIQWRQEIRRLNTLGMKGSSLRLYARSANQYECKERFTPEFTQTCLEHTLAWLEPSP
jgi:hypothetical protein